jgi:hypothetical protein
MNLTALNQLGGGPVIALDSLPDPVLLHPHGSQHHAPAGILAQLRECRIGQ